MRKRKRKGGETGRNVAARGNEFGRNGARVADNANRSRRLFYRGDDAIAMRSRRTRDRRAAVVGRQGGTGREHSLEQPERATGGAIDAASHRVTDTYACSRRSPAGSRPRPIRASYDMRPDAVRKPGGAGIVAHFHDGGDRAETRGCLCIARSADGAPRRERRRRSDSHRALPLRPTTSERLRLRCPVRRGGSGRRLAVRRRSAARRR